MPVSIDDHDPDVDLRPGTTKSDIVAFLYRHDEYGYSPQDLRNDLNIPHGTAKVTLKRLYDSGYIDKTPDGYYHARRDREDLYRYTAALDGLDRMFATHEEVDSTDEPEDNDADAESATLTDDDIDEAVGLLDDADGDDP